ETSTCRLELPPDMVRRRIHDTFHMSLLRPYQANNDRLFPKRELSRWYDFGQPDKDDWYITGVIGHAWQDDHVRLLVQWSLGN
ncbi:uncharacterized protein STEHIDRAFT_35241, partial [Stereum hirsutum FP-91666 SS1]